MTNQVDMSKLDNVNPLLLVTTVGEICEMFLEDRNNVKYFLYSGKFMAMQSKTIWLIWLPSVIQHFGRMPSYWPARFGFDNEKTTEAEEE
jgi:hypothetical protein